MMQNKKIAVTGGIGSGKSAFCKFLKDAGVPVFSCDEIYREILQTDEYLSALKGTFPDCFDGKLLNKQRLADKIFSDSDERERLNRLAHPRIMSKLLGRMAEHKVAVAEVPLLFEGGYENLFDAVIVVTRKEKSRIVAVAERDGVSPEQVLARIGSQRKGEPPANCIVVENDGSLAQLRQSAERILNGL